MQEYDAYEFERCFVELVTEMAEQQGMNHSQFAKKAFGDTSSAISRWRKIRNMSASKPQSVTIVDALQMAAALGMDLPSLTFRVDQQYKMQKEMFQGKTHAAG